MIILEILEIIQLTNNSRNDVFFWRTWVVEVVRKSSLVFGFGAIHGCFDAVESSWM